MKTTPALLLLAAFSIAGYADTPWYERFSLRGYTQLRYVEQRSIADRTPWASGGFSIRRGRLILSGFITRDVFFYLQPDFAASSGTALHVLQLRDAYFDIFLDSAHAFRLRVGQSKVPYGYENMQSSSLRLPMERADALNSASVPGERDIGVFLSWAPPAARALYSKLTRNGQKGSGDYGCVSIGIYNGQGINRPKFNHTPYWTARVTYPIEWAGTVIEPGAQAYVGRFTPQVSSSVQQATTDHRDERYAVTLAIAPEPIGLLAEYAWGHAPRYEPSSNGGGYIRSGRIEGGFVTLFARTHVAGFLLYPFARVQSLHGGIKSLQDAPMTDMLQWEAGIEWHLSSTLELTIEYMHTDRRSLASSGQNSSLTEALWLQLQVNY